MEGLRRSGLGLVEFGDGSEGEDDFRAVVEVALAAVVVEKREHRGESFDV